MLFATDVPLHRFHGIRFKVKRGLVVGRQSIFFVPVRSTAMKHNQQKLKLMELKKSLSLILDGVVLDTEGQYTVFWQTIGERYCTEVPDFSTRIKGMSLVQILASHEKLQQHEHEIRKAIDEV